MRPTFACLLALAAPTPALAQDFHCRNTDAEINCGAGKCSVETQSFTPMELRRTGGRLSICAYSGCWAGPVLVRRQRHGIELLFADVRGTTPGAGTGALAVIYERRERIAQIRWGGSANAMTCD